MRNLFLVYLAIILLSVGLSSCSTRQYQLLFEKRAALNDTSYDTKASGLENYKIQPQDVLQIRNLQNIKYIVDETPNAVAGNSQQVNTGIGQTYQVEEDGTVALPLIGSTPVVGLTRTEAQNFIKEVYRKTLLKDPIIELKITNLKVTLLGEVRTQGNYQLTKDKTTLIDMIGLAGGLTDKANEKTVKIIRGTSKSPQVSIIDLNTISSVNDPRAILQSGDIIYVAQSKRAIRNDNLQNLSLLVQPISLILTTLTLLLTISRISK